MADLNYINYLNLVGYIINVLVTAFAAPIFNLTDNATLSAKYQTIITPAGFTFAIWGVIFLSQLIFTIYQMLPQHRSADIVQYSVGLMYFYACIAQSAWTFIFGSEILWLSVVAMFCILVSLSWIVIQQTKNDATIQEFWLFKFPFLIHFGWIFTAFLLNVNLFMVAAGANAIVQILSALISLVLVVLLAVVSLYFTIILPIGPFYTVPGVFIWATFGIAIELLNPKTLIVETFSTGQIEFFRILAACLSAILLAGTVGYGIYDSCSKKDGANGAVIDESTPLVT